MTSVFVVGDSISIHYGPALERALRGFAAYARKAGDEEARLNLDDPRGANGGDSARVVNYLERRVAAGDLQTSWLLVNCGLHDLRTDPASGRRQVEPDAYRANLEALVSLAVRLGSRLAWVRTTPVDEAVHNVPGRTYHRFSRDVDLYNLTADNVMRRAGVPIADLFSFTRGLGPHLYCDHVHFHEPVREAQGAFLAGWLVGMTRSTP